MKLETGLLVVVRFGFNGTQLARLRRFDGTLWVAEKWRANSRQWTGYVPVPRGEIIRLATQEDRKRVSL